MTAVSNGDKDEVKMLLSKGADPNASPPMVPNSCHSVCLKDIYSMHYVIIDAP